MTSADDRVNRRLWSFFALTYGLSWIFWIPAAVFGQDFTTTAWGIPYLVAGFGPSAAGVIMMYRTRDRGERRDFWRRVVDFKRISLVGISSSCSSFP